jgi:hypothetical protein
VRRKSARVLGIAIVFALVLLLGGAAAVLQRGATRLIEVPYELDALAFAPDGAHFATLGLDGHEVVVALWTRDGALVRRVAVPGLDDGRSADGELHFTTDGRALVVRRGVLLARVDVAPGAAAGLLAGANVHAVSATGEVALVSSTDETGRLVFDAWRLDGPKRASRMPGEQVSSAALSRDGELAALGVEGANLELRATASGALVRELDMREAPDVLVFSPRGTYVAGTKAATNLLVVWRASGGPPAGPPPEDIEPAVFVAFDPAERSICLSTNSGVELWALEPLARAERLGERPDASLAYGLTISEDGRTLAWLELQDGRSKIHLCPLDAAGRLRRRLIGTR